MKTTTALNALLDFSRQHSDYYRQHLHQVPGKLTTLAELPVIDPAHYWQGSHNLDQWPVLTAAGVDALVFKTGGSTGSGKLSLFTREEWQTLVSDFGKHLSDQLNPGDRVANLFYVGDLYASFLFIHDSLAQVRGAVSEFPFTGAVESGVLAEAITEYRINVLAGVPAQLLKFAAWLEQRSQRLEGVKTVLYGGESLFCAQRQILARVFPEARFASIGYASVDAGLIGTSDRDCAPGEHRMLESHSVVEILDEVSGEVIEECGRNGQLVITNLTRRLMPLIRYPVGDLACWREPPATARRKFALMGRSMNGQRVRVGTLSLQIGEIDNLMQRLRIGSDWQLVIEQRGAKDLLSLKWLPDAQGHDSEAANTELRLELIRQYPMIEQLQNEQLLELQVTRCDSADLICHPRSGKLQRIVDRRVYQAPAGEQT
ncbi:phenylacetate--CoA ligase family protein [Pseudomonas sp. HMWF021]|uniref:phenylacetate--CoA ligase family protein n=1 Tax=Pseudomonas sp. HMWF021 TaxID=2056857 RepID=UPI000D3C34CD|nr:AMP-binding protein [Pseudomonas sp. HMWF021]PTT32149.1 AMP-dependent synthetase [Pseudomonas sp. HMWF021]